MVKAFQIILCVSELNHNSLAEIIIMGSGPGPVFLDLASPIETYNFIISDLSQYFCISQLCKLNVPGLLNGPVCVPGQ